MTQIILLIVLSIYGLLSILKQFPRFQPALNRLDPFGLLPYWAFFAPKPGTSDLRVLARKKDADGNLGPWSEIRIYEPRRALHLLWRPDKLLQKCVSDCARALLREGSKSGEDNRDLMQASWPYIKLAQLAFRDHHLEKDELRQFAIVGSEGIDRRRVFPLFMSKWHA